MNVFKTPQEVIAACDAECERSWKVFVETHGFVSDTPETLNTMKIIFRNGYMSGASFVSGYFARNLQKHAQTSIIDPGA